MYYNFNPDLPEPLNVIHPLQVPGIKQLMSNAFPEDIELIILFGSSLDLTCGIFSDLDLFIITNSENEFDSYETVRALCLPIKKRFDILVSNMENFLYASKQHGTIESNLMRKGVCIYAGKKGYFTRQG